MQTTTGKQPPNPMFVVSNRNGSGTFEEAEGHLGYIGN